MRSAEAKRRLGAARQAEAAAKDESAARLIREYAAKAAECAREADTRLSEAVAAINELYSAVRDMNRLNEGPSEMMVTVNSVRALHTSLMQLAPSLAREYPHVGPLERRTFRSFWQKMHEPLEARVRGRLGETETNKGAAS
jgi:hypothetical protein